MGPLRAPPTHPFLDHPGPIAFAHRGGAAEAPENSMAAFEAAVALGYRYLETDVHATADGVLVAFHDHRLDRVTDRQGVVAERTWDEVARARIDGQEPIPRFEDLLDAWPDVRINVDTKHDAAVRPLLAIVERLRAADRVCVGSFSGRRVRAVRAALGDAACTALTRREVAALWARARGPRREGGTPARRRVGGRCVQVPVGTRLLRLTDRRFVARAHAEGLPVHVWTVDAPAQMRRLLDLGVDGLMTDRPAVLRAVLEERGAWIGAARHG